MSGNGADRPRLLVLSPWFPYPPDNGSRVRIYHLLRELSRSFRIRLVAGLQEDSPAPGAATALESFCDSVVALPWRWHRSESQGTLGALRALVSPVPLSILQTRNPPLAAAIATEMDGPIDAVLVCELGMDAYLPAEIRPGLPLVLEGAEVSGMEQAFRNAKGSGARLRRGLALAKGRQYWRRRFRARYRAVTAVSAAEAGALRTTMGRPDAPPVIVIPNGVSVEEYAPRDLESIVPGRLIYNGALTYGPNRDAVEWFIREILPRIRARSPHAHLFVTGRRSDADAAAFAEGSAVTLTGYLSDLRPTLATAAVCVAPLRGGGGTRLKILEAWAAGVPVVSTTVGANGLTGAENGTHLLLADDPAAFADAVLRVLADPKAAANLAGRGRELVETRYDWRAIGAELSEKIMGLLAP